MFSEELKQQMSEWKNCLKESEEKYNKESKTLEKIKEKCKEAISNDCVLYPGGDHNQQDIEDHYFSKFAKEIMELL